MTNKSEFYVLKFPKGHIEEGKYIVMVMNCPTAVGFLVDAQKFLTKERALELGTHYNLDIDVISYTVKPVKKPKIKKKVTL